jgi:hypothetical protein
MADISSYVVTPAQLLKSEVYITVYIGLSHQQLQSIRSEAPEKVRGNIVKEVAEKRHRRYHGDSGDPVLLTIQLSAVGLLTMFCMGALRFSEDVARWSFQVPLYSQMYDAAGHLLYKCTGVDLPVADPPLPISMPSVVIFFCLSENQARGLHFKLVGLGGFASQVVRLQTSASSGIGESCEGYFAGRLSRDSAIVRRAKLVECDPFYVAEMRLSAEGFMTFITCHALDVSSDRSRWRFYMPLHAQVLGDGGCELYRIVSTYGPVVCHSSVSRQRKYCL